MAMLIQAGCIPRCAGADIDALGFVFLRAPASAVLTDVAYSGLPTQQVSLCAVAVGCHVALWATLRRDGRFWLIKCVLLLRAWAADMHWLS